MALRSSTIVRMPRTLSRLVLYNCTCTYNSETTVALVIIVDFVSTKSGLPPHLVCGNKSMLRIWTVQASWEAGWGSSTRETAGIAGGTGVAGRRLAEDSRELHIEYSIAVCLKYVNFHAVDAVDDMYYFGGLFISLIELFFSRGNPPGRRTGYRTIVENLSSRTSWQDLKDFMRKVTNTNLCLNSFFKCDELDTAWLTWSTMRYHPEHNHSKSLFPVGVREWKLWLIIDRCTAGWWDHLHQHQPTQSGRGHCRVWKQVGTKSSKIGKLISYVQERHGVCFGQVGRRGAGRAKDPAGWGGRWQEIEVQV